MAVAKLSDNRSKLAASAAAMAEEVASAAAKTWAKLARDEAEELKSAAFWGTIRAAKTWEPSKGAWDYWARIHVDGEIKEYLGSRRRRRWRKVKVHLDTEHLADARRAEQDFVDAEDRLDRMLRPLPERHRTLCVHMYRHGLSLTEAALVAGLSKSRASRVHQEALDILRDNLAAA